MGFPTWWRPPQLPDVATMVAWSLKKKEAEKKPDPKAAALPFYKRFTYPFTRKQTLLGLLIFSLILSVLAVVTWYVVPARVAAGGGSRQLPHPRHHLSHQPRDGDRWTGRTRLRLSIAPR